MMAPLSSIVPCGGEEELLLHKQTHSHCLQPFGSDDCLMKGSLQYLFDLNRKHHF
jgi:hypothetical protein